MEIAQPVRSGYSDRTNVEPTTISDKAHRMIEPPSQGIPYPAPGRAVTSSDARTRHSDRGNSIFRAAREATVSRSKPGFCMSRDVLAEAVNEYMLYKMT